MESTSSHAGMARCSSRRLQVWRVTRAQSVAVHLEDVARGPSSEMEPLLSMLPQTTALSCVSGP